MTAYPEFQHLKRHAKHISKTFAINLTAAQDVVALIHDCSTWAELKEQSTQNQGSHDHSDFDCIPSSKELLELRTVLAPYLDGLKHSFDSSIHIPGSILDKIIKDKCHHLPGRAVKHLLYVEKPDKTYSTTDILELIYFLDDTFSKVLVRRDRINEQININSSLYGHYFYGYCDFDKQYVQMLIREWDLRLGSPCFDDSENCKRKSISSRKWFKDYMLGFIRRFISQCQRSGYSGRIKITRIQNAYVSKWLRGEPDKYRTENIESLFKAISNLPEAKIILYTPSTSYSEDAIVLSF